MNQRVLNVLILSISLLFTQGLFAQPQTANIDEKPIILFVEFEFNAKDIALAKELLTDMQNQSLDNEEGCISYDILLSGEQPNTIFIYECYENEVALKKHNSTPYFKSIVEKKLAPIIKSQKIQKLKPMNDFGAIAF